MKQKIFYGSWNKTADIISGIIWVIFIALFVLFLVFFHRPYEHVWFWLTFGFFILAWIWSFICIPVSVSADEDYIRVHKPLNSKKYKISDIKSIDQNPNAHKNYVYYGSPKNPVYVTMKDGKQFVVGTSDPKEFIDYVNSRKK